MHVIKIEPGNTVLCDFCGDDYADSSKSGGIYFQSKAVCPACTPGLESDVKKYHEEHLIHARCPSQMSFANWVREELR